MERIYVSGPMTGITGYNFPAFEAAACALRAAGFDVESPHEQGADPSRSWEDYLRADLHLLLGCEAVATLPGWENSRGARLECQVAGALGMEIASVDAFLARDGF